MLNRNCQKIIGLLMTNKDFNVRITVAENTIPTTRFTQKSAIVGAWKEYIRDSLGAIVNSDKELNVTVTVAKCGDVKDYMANIEGNELVNHFWEQIRFADGIRVSISQKGKLLSWIIVRP